MQIELRDIDSITPYEKNPRLNGDAVDAVAASIREFGFRAAIVVDAGGVIICGHTRWKAARKLQLAKVPVHVAPDLTPEQVKAYRIADNKTAELAEWDFDQLRIEIADLQGTDFDLGLLAFDDEELTRLLAGDGNVVTDGQTDPDAVPDPPRRGGQPSWRNLPARRASPDVRRFIQPPRCRSPAWRSADPSGQHRPSLQRQGRAAQQQCSCRDPPSCRVRHGCVEGVDIVAHLLDLGRALCLTGGLKRNDILECGLGALDLRGDRGLFAHETVQEPVGTGHHAGGQVQPFSCLRGLAVKNLLSNRKRFRCNALLCV